MLMTSISGIRGTIGGQAGENLTPIDIVNFAAAYAAWMKQQHSEPRVVIGRDGRVSGDMIMQLVIQTLRASGVGVIDLGPATTPTVEMLVIREQASGGIVITASHNPREYNGIKMLNDQGEFLSADEGQALLDIIQSSSYDFVEADELGSSTEIADAHAYHVQQILDLDIVDVDAIRDARFSVAVDTINSVGGLIVPMLLDALGVTCEILNGACDGKFAHAPEPVAENLTELQEFVKSNDVQLGIAVDPDVDRLVLVDEKGDMFGEEYTLVVVADYVLSHIPGNVVTNVSSTQALGDLAKKYNVECHQSAVGEKNVVEKMREVNAVIGGEGSGGVIYPPLHYGRDAVIGIALILGLLASRLEMLSEMKSHYTAYAMIKQKVTLTPSIDIEALFQKLSKLYADQQLISVDGLKIVFPDRSWLHLRKSNTEPIIRIFAEAHTESQAQSRVDEVLQYISNSS